MMKKQYIFNGKALRAAHHQAAVAAALVGALLLAGCASTQGPGKTSDSGVEVYGEIDVGYGHSRTRTRVQSQ